MWTLRRPSWSLRTTRTCGCVAGGSGLVVLVVVLMLGVATGVVGAALGSGGVDAGTLSSVEVVLLLWPAASMSHTLSSHVPGPRVLTVADPPTGAVAGELHSVLLAVQTWYSALANGVVGFVGSCQVALNVLLPG